MKTDCVLRHLTTRHTCIHHAYGSTPHSAVGGRAWPQMRDDLLARGPDHASSRAGPYPNRRQLSNRLQVGAARGTRALSRKFNPSLG